MREQCRARRKGLPGSLAVEEAFGLDRVKLTLPLAPFILCYASRRSLDPHSELTGATDQRMTVSSGQNCATPDVIKLVGPEFEGASDDH